jgi:acyl-CoA dehydrogenase
VADFTPPLDDIRFALERAGLSSIDPQAAEVADAVLAAAGELVVGVLAPLNRPGDVGGTRWRGGEVSLPAGWRDAYRQFCEGG